MNDKPLLMNRRELARSSVLGGTAFLLGNGAMASAQTPTSDTMLDIRNFGAAGDGHTVNTAAIQKAIDAAAKNGGAVFLPPGNYLTGELHARPNVSLIGMAGWDYRAPGGTVLRLADPAASCLLNISEAQGATIEGLALEGGGLGKNIHGMFVDRPAFGKREDAFRIERCQVAGFSGHGANLAGVWCFSIRHCMFAHNGGDGINMRGWDGFLMDNWLSGNAKAGYASREGGSSVTFTANRVEWNHEENMLLAGSDGYQITGNFFDRAGSCGLALRKRGTAACSQMSITGNYFKRSGKLVDAASHDCSQIVLEECAGVVCIGNTMWATLDDFGHGTAAPSFGIVYGGLSNCVIRDNVLHDGATRQLVLDTGGPSDGLSIGENPGRLFVS